jgi:hypothetical protein
VTQPNITPYDRSVLTAVRALFDGNANEGQQKRAMEWIVFNLCHVGQLSFDTESQRVSDRREGERFVGLQLAWIREPIGLQRLEEWEKAKATRAVKRGEKND